MEEPAATPPQKNPFFKGVMILAKKAWKDALVKSKDLAGTNYALAQYHLQNGHLKDAYWRFRIVTWLRPKHEGAWAGIARVYIAQNEIIKAKRALKSLRQINPGNAEAAELIASLKTKPAKAAPFVSGAETVE